MIEKIGIRELKNQTSQVLRRVREDMVEYVVTLRGEPVAVLRPLTQDESEHIRQVRIEDEIADLRSLSKLIAASWTSEISAVELVEEQRR
ncbi:MAG: type II toxin-antitoxin system prevent-host-death family antitoxin [Chloroflexota bacterium]|nr:type II toxin-antitoxin system prevent-host-death family antitoxin [Chloroflexota bacterium]